MEAIHGHALIVTAAGSSMRFNDDSSNNPCMRECANGNSYVDGKVKKEFLEIDGISILSRSIAPFLSIPGLEAIVVTCRKGLESKTRNSLEPLGAETMDKIHFVEGGETRQDSVFNALLHLKTLHDDGLDFDLVSIHDGARPFVSRLVIERCLNAALAFGGAAPCVPIADTLVKVEAGIISESVDRTGVQGVQTPQSFRFPDILEAHIKAKGAGSCYTDDTQVFSSFGGRVAAVQGDPRNLKITFGRDIEAYYKGF